MLGLASFSHLRTRRVPVALLVLARLATVLLALQFSGGVHDLIDVTRAVMGATAEEPEHEQCPPDKPCDDCPPGCPNCHCAAIGTLVLTESPTLPPLTLGASLPRSLVGAQAPSGPEPPSLFRPPRA